MKSNDTKSENFHKDFEEILERAHQIGWNESAERPSVWAEKNDDDSPCSNQRFVVKPTDGKRSDPGG